MTTVIFPGYNFICFLLLLLLVWCEESKKSDYIIGVILGLIFCTKQTIGISLFIPTFIILFKSYKRFLKRLVGYIIPICIMFLYLICYFASLLTLSFLKYYLNRKRQAYLIYRFLQ